MERSLSSSAQLLAMEARRLKRCGGASLPRLVFMTDDERVPDPVKAVQNLPRGALIVFRHYAATDREYLGRAVLRAGRSSGHKVLVAGDWQLAARIGADGVHLPEYLSRQARGIKRRRSDWVVTAAAHSMGAVQNAAQAGADGVFLSPIFPTKSHKNEKGLGVLKAAQIIQQAQLPVYALGGVNEKTARLLRGTRLHGFACIEALL